MAKKYKYHHTYAVAWWSKKDWQTHWEYGMTYHEAIKFARKLEKSPNGVYWVEVVNRVYAFDAFGKENKL